MLQLSRLVVCVLLTAHPAFGAGDGSAPKARTELVISGRVIDAETKQPIKKFDFMPGFRHEHNRAGVGFYTGQRETATGGTYRISQRVNMSIYIVRIEAEGYRPALSRDIKNDERNATIDFELVPIKTYTARVVTPEAQPAAGATVGLAEGRATIMLENDAILDPDPKLPPVALQRFITDDAGEFKFPGPEKYFQLVIIHPTGYVQFKALPDWKEIKTIRLEPWARVEGTLRTGGVLSLNVPVTIGREWQLPYPLDDRNVMANYSTKTGKDGRFVFERVIPGSGYVSRPTDSTPDDDAGNSISSGMVFVRFRSGKTTSVDLGGTGRPVVGKLEPPEARRGEIKWNLAQVIAIPSPPEVPRINRLPSPPELQGNAPKAAEWWEQWHTSAEGLAWIAAYEKYNDTINATPTFRGTVRRDGTFRIEGMPAGTYRLSARYDNDRAMFPGWHAFTIPEIPGGRSDEPLDLGVQTLQQKK